MSSDDIQKIKDKLDIVELISSYIKLEKAGINYKGKCPFHNEKTPSFFVSRERQNFYCFGCQEKGDIFSFVQKFEGLDFKGALQILADKAGVKLTRTINEPKENKEKLFEIMEEATRLYQKNLEENSKALAYLKNRGLGEPTIRKWRLGFAKNEWRNTLEVLTSQGFNKETMLKVGLIKKNEESGKYYDTFRNRIMFPICDAAGRVIAFSGRTMAENEKTPKYLNSPETELFHKSEVLYGLHFAKNEIRKADYAVLVEGQMDLLMSQESGVTNTVASSGTALTINHLKKIQSLSNRLIIGYDSDAAGEKAAKRAAELAISLGIETKIASLEENEDPASIIKKDPSLWRESLKKASYFIDFLIEKSFQKYKGEKLIKEISREVLPFIALLKSEMEKSAIIKKIALKTGVNENAIWKDLEKINLKEDGREILNLKKEEKTQSLERVVASIIFFEESLNPENQNKNFRKKIEEIIGEKLLREIISEYESEKEALIFKVEIQNEDQEKFEKTKTEILKRIEKDYFKKRLRELSSQLDKAEFDKEKETEIKLEISKIQKSIANL